MTTTQTGETTNQQIQRLAAQFAQQFVRKDSKYFDVDHLGTALAAPDVEQMILNQLVERFPEVEPSSTLLNATPIMKQLQQTSRQTNLDILEEHLNAQKYLVIPQDDVAKYVREELGSKASQVRHLMDELGWVKSTVKWGGADYARSIWTRPGYAVDGGKVYGPEADGVLARVICDVPVIALGAGRHMPAKRLGPAGFNGRHDLELREAQMPCIGPPIGRSMIAKDVGNLQRVPWHAAAPVRSHPGYARTGWTHCATS